MPGDKLSSNQKPRYNKNKLFFSFSADVGGVFIIIGFILLALVICSIPVCLIACCCWYCCKTKSPRETTGTAIIVNTQQLHLVVPPQAPSPTAPPLELLEIGAEPAPRVRYSGAELPPPYSEAEPPPPYSIK